MRIRFPASIQQARRGGEALRGEAELDIREDVGKRAIIGLRPAIKGMLMALGAFDPHAQKCRSRALGQGFHGDIAVAGEAPPVQIEARLGRVVGGRARFEREHPLGFTIDP